MQESMVTSSVFTFGENEWKDIYAPLVCVNGQTELLQGYEGFSPRRGHEYRLKVRRIYITDYPEYHHYELLEVLSDTPSSKGDG